MAQEKTKPADTPAAPSPEEMQKLTQVGQAGAEAQASGGDVAQAMKEKRDEVGLQMSDADLEKVSEQLFGRLEGLFRESGALDPPVEPVRMPEQPAVPAAPPPAAAAEQIPAPEQPTPRKRTLAQRFFGEG